MKNYLLILILLSSCSVSEQTPVVTKTNNAPIAPQVKKEPFELLDIIKTRSGYLQSYRYGNDTIYMIEGFSQSYPVAITIK